MTARRRVGAWLAIWAGMVVLLVVIGGATRLTESGLSITEWKPVTGVLPPLDRAAWDAEFARYQQIPEYQQFNRGMSLAQFQVIYLWEFTHRLWARLVGLAFALPLVVFLWRREVSGPLAWRLGGLLVLLGLQGAMGWYMVQSGLTLRTDVSQYRLAAHLSLALVLYGAAVWTAADLLGVRGRGITPGIEGAGRLRRLTGGFAGFAFLTIVSGAFVAGLNAGSAWNTFPLMGGRVVPPGYLAMSPWYRNLFENVTAVQFHHRLLGLGVVVSAILLWRASRRVELTTHGRSAFAALPLVALLQVTLGISTLLLRVPVVVAVLHQLGAVLVLTAGLLALAAVQTTNGRQRAPAVVESGASRAISSG
ncbi:MAG TPA: COX15/CtaA family protein [Gemmatimonadales bacterium]|nr:COX15/CtaA family protein [Gemmatimonadales bacterium]